MRTSAHERWWQPFRQVGPVEVTHVDLTPDAGRAAVASTWLDHRERARWVNFPHETPRHQFALCRAALRALLCNELGCGNEQLSFGTGRHGKPFALIDGKPAQIGFNVSHSGKHGLIALARQGRLGVDVEERARHKNLDDLIDAVLGPNEQADIAAASGESRIDLFFSLWTLKEALLKAVGTGLSFDASRFEIPRQMRRGVRASTVRLPEMPEVLWQLENIGNEEFCAAVASDRGAW